MDEASARTVDILGVRFDDIGFAGTVDRIEGWARDGSGGYVCTPNVDFIVQTQRDPSFMEALAGARLRVPDGMGVIYGSRLRGTPLSSTVTGRKLPEAVAMRLANSGHSLGLFGGPPGAATRAGERIATSGAEVSLAITPTMGFVIGSRDDESWVHTIAASRVRVLFVGLGAPKQELWMARHQHDLPNTVMVGVGQSIAVLAGDTPAAPDWMTRIGLEWAFRLIHEPRRLARRYLWDDPRFFWWMLRDRLR